MINYVNNLKTQFKVISATGYSRGHQFKGMDITRALWSTGKTMSSSTGKLKAVQTAASLLFF